MSSLISKALTVTEGAGITPVSLAILAAVLVLFWISPRTFHKIHYGITRFLGALASRPAVALLIAAAVPVVFRIALLPSHPIPAPSIHDEFSNLLAADTFAHRRVTNPSHPLFQFFETFHVLPSPTYMSKYPPVQALFLAAGQVLFGHPWWGVLLSIAIMGAASCWMLRGWLPPRWALLGAIAIGLQFGVGYLWANSYWGGAPAAIGACLVLGAFARFKQYRPIPSRPMTNGVLFALGIVILFNSRPWEGLAILAPVGIALLAWINAERIRTVLLPAAAVLAVAAAAMLYYNWRITENPLSMPYTVVHKTYSVAPLFVWQKRTPAPEYRHAVMKRFYLDQEHQYQSADKAETLRGWLSLQPGRARMGKDLLFGNFFLLLCLAFAIYRPARSLLPLMAVLAVFGIALTLESWSQPHYFAPVVAVAMVLKLSALRRISAFVPAGTALTAAILLISTVRIVQGSVEFPTPDAFALERAAIQQQLESMPGEHVVFVRYSETHPPSEEWVYNRADIDGSKVVWAREMDAFENGKLLEYFNGRTFWRIAPDDSPAHLEPLARMSTSGSAVSLSTESPLKETVVQ